MTESFNESQMVVFWYFWWSWIVLWNTSAGRVEQYIIQINEMGVGTPLEPVKNCYPCICDDHQSSGTQRLHQRTDQWTSWRSLVPVRPSLHQQLDQRWTCLVAHNNKNFASSTPSSCSWRSVQKFRTFVPFGQTIVQKNVRVQMPYTLGEWSLFIVWCSLAVINPGSRSSRPINQMQIRLDRKRRPSRGVATGGLRVAHAPLKYTHWSESGALCMWQSPSFVTYRVIQHVQLEVKRLLCLLHRMCFNTTRVTCVCSLMSLCISSSSGSRCPATAVPRPPSGTALSAACGCVCPLTAPCTFLWRGRAPPWSPPPPPAPWSGPGDPRWGAPRGRCTPGPDPWEGPPPCPPALWKTRSRR